MKVAFSFNAFKFFTCPKDELKETIQKMFNEDEYDVENLFEDENIVLPAMYALFTNGCDWNYLSLIDADITGHTEETITIKFSFDASKVIDVPELIINHIIKAVHTEFEGDEYLEKCELGDRLTDIFKQYNSGGLSMWTYARLYEVRKDSPYGAIIWES